MRKLLLTLTLMLFIRPCQAHGFSGSGFLHPLTGIDHLVAMIAVGAWSAQIGGKAIYKVPAAFMIMMCIGGISGIYSININFTEFGIALSVILLGASITINKRVAWYIAAIAVGLFGFCHGYSHGREIPHQHNILLYMFGFLLTTLGLHIVGAVGTLLLLEEKRGKATLSWLGTAAFIIGIYLFLKLL